MFMMNPMPTKIQPKVLYMEKATLISKPLKKRLMNIPIVLLTIMDIWFVILANLKNSKQEWIKN